MKVCLINNLYKPFNRGGAEKVAETIANGLVKVGHEVFIITTKPYGGKTPIRQPASFASLALGRSGPAGGQAGNPRIYYLNSLYYNLNKLPKFLRLLWHIWDMFNLVNYFKIKRILKREKCDAVITNNLMGLGFLIPLAIKRLKLKHIHLVHDIQLIHPAGLMLFGQEKIIDGLWARNYAGLTSRLFASPRAVIFPSRWLRDRYLDKIFFIKSKRIVLPNPVALPAITPTEKTNDKFLYLGQIEKHKGINLLIQAFKKVKEKFPRAELIIVGRGSELEQAKIQAGPDDNIKFLGWPGDEAADKLMLSGRCLVYPSLVYENCPHAIQRAFSAGLPVIAADLGGISELIGENTAGLLFRPGNAADLIDKMEWAIERRNDLAEMARAGKIKAASCGVENYIKELEGLIEL